MKITRYPQSCLLLEKDGHKIAIDPGKFFADAYSIDELKGVEAVLYTHEHIDHYDPEIGALLIKKGVDVYANASTAKLIGQKGDVCKVVYNNDHITVAGFEIVAYELPHCLLPDGSDGPQNTGYLIDSVFFDPGDGKELAGLSAQSMALPIIGPDISMLDAFNFAKQVGAKVAIPVHYQWLGADPEIYKTFATRMNMPFELRVLGDGESTNI